MTPLFFEFLKIQPKSETDMRNNSDTIIKITIKM